MGLATFMNINFLVKQSYDSFEMLPNELIKDVYSRLNLIVNELNAIGLTKVSNADVLMKTVFVLPTKKYGSIIAILHNMDSLSIMTPILAIRKIVAFEMAKNMGQEEATLSRQQSIAFTCDEHKKINNKGKQVESSSITSGDEEDDDDKEEGSTSSSNDEEVMELIRD
jgi:hypothetical protein